MKGKESPWCVKVLGLELLGPNPDPCRPSITYLRRLPPRCCAAVLAVLPRYLPRCRTATLPRCHAAVLPRCQPRCHAAPLPRCRAAPLPCCPAACPGEDQRRPWPPLANLLTHRRAAPLPAAAVPPCCPAVPLPGCPAAPLPCCPAACPGETRQSHQRRPYLIKKPRCERRESN